MKMNYTSYEGITKYEILLCAKKNLLQFNSFRRYANIFPAIVSASINNANHFTFM